MQYLYHNNAHPAFHPLGFCFCLRQIEEFCWVFREQKPAVGNQSLVELRQNLPIPLSLNPFVPPSLGSHCANVRATSVRYAVIPGMNPTKDARITIAGRRMYSAG